MAVAVALACGGKLQSTPTDGGTGDGAIPRPDGPSSEASSDAGAGDGSPRGDDAAQDATSEGCSPGETACLGAEAGCVDTNSDPNNCGACFELCPRGIACKGGECQCPPGTTLCCNGDFNCTHVCADLLTDPVNCGRCSTGPVQSCYPPQTCVDGGCRCPDGQIMCGWRDCADLAMDQYNCGKCGVSCAPMQTCRDGGCS